MVLVNKENTFKVIGLFILILLLLVQPAAAQLTFACSAQSDMVEAECEALKILYSSTNGDFWVDNTGWLVAANPCTWYGVTCNGSNVSSLSLPSNTLDGTLPPEIGDFPFMTYLDLSGNALTGPLPPEIRQLVNLVTLDIAVNGFSGNLPSEVGDLSLLQTLDIGNNTFDGEVPLSFANLTSLSYFDTTANTLCLPDDAALQNWYLGIATKIGSLSACFVPDTETPTPVPDTLTPTPIPLPTNTPTATNTPTITPTPTMLGPFQTLTAFAYEDTLTATANWFRTPSPQATATRYYILVSQTLIPGGEDQQGPQVDGGPGSDLPIPGEDGDISSLWWLLLIIPIGLIGAGIFLELRGRRSQASDSSSKDDNDDEGFQTFL